MVRFEWVGLPCSPMSYRIHCMVCLTADCSGRCHNPEIHAFSFNGSRLFVLFHIGDGVNGQPVNCTSSAVQHFDPHAQQLRQTVAKGATVHTATSLDGPWTPVQGFPSCNNPTALQHANGTLYALCDSSVLWRSDHIDGPWTTVGSLDLSGGPDCGLEDGFMWMDAANAWHILFHCWSNVPPPSGSCVNTNVSAHAFSYDGLDWAIWPTQPFDGMSYCTKMNGIPSLDCQCHLINT
jgi:hypothetical protein